MSCKGSIPLSPTGGNNNIALPLVTKPVRNRSSYTCATGWENQSPIFHTSFKQLFAESIVTFLMAFHPKVDVYVHVHENYIQSFEQHASSYENVSQLMERHCIPQEHDLLALEELLSLPNLADENDLDFKLNPIQLQTKEVSEVQQQINKQCCQCYHLHHRHFCNGASCKWIDTHAKPHPIVGVDLPDFEANRAKIGFTATPNAVSTIVPMTIDIQSSLKRNQIPISPTTTTAAAASSAALSSVLEEDDFQLLHQGLERMFQTIQFRAYLSKFFVILSNGIHSFLLLYRHEIYPRQEEQHRFTLNIIPIPTDKVDVLITKIQRAAEREGSSYYLTSHGPLILNTLHQLQQDTKYWLQRDSIYRIRVEFVACSQNTVYMITEPSSNTGTVSVKAKAKTYAFKIYRHNKMKTYLHEVSILETLIYKKPISRWRACIERCNKLLTTRTEEEGDDVEHPKIDLSNVDPKDCCYFLKAYTFDERLRQEQEEEEGARPRWKPYQWRQQQGQRTAWFATLPTIEQDKTSGGVIITKPGFPGLRSLWETYPDSEEDFIKSQLFNHLRYLHHKNIVHTDIRTDNILFYANAWPFRWQLIDFDCAQILSSSTSTAKVSIQKGSNRYFCSSKRIQALGANVEMYHWYEVEYTKKDDREMLQNALLNIKDVVNQARITYTHISYRYEYYFSEPGEAKYV